jgi:hypothetical protein
MWQARPSWSAIPCPIARYRSLRIAPGSRLLRRRSPTKSVSSRSSSARRRAIRADLVRVHISGQLRLCLRHAPAVDALRHAVFQSPCSTEPAARVAAGRGGELPEPLAAYAAKVRDQSYRIGDADFAGLTSAGLGDDAIFEITIAAAVGTALQRLDAGLRAVRGGC